VEEKKMRRFSFSLIVALALAVAIPWNNAVAAPPGESRDLDVGKKLFSFNVLAVPQTNWTDSRPVQPAMIFLSELTLDLLIGVTQPNALRTSKSM
jgi:4-amino-4-deoxy-L-arabinose transferase-like glycosyltransferase